MNDFSIGMALFDYIPVIFFALGAFILLRDFHNKVRKDYYILFATGVIAVALAGTLKATWKLLYAAEICNLVIFDELFFPLQSMGFLLAGVGIMSILFFKSSKKPSLFAMEPSLLIMILLMVSGLGFLDAGLCILSKKLKKPALIAIFAVSFVCCLGMGYLSSKDFAKASMNWIAEFVNFFGQGLFLLGVWMLHKAGLDKLELEK